LGRFSHNEATTRIFDKVPYHISLNWLITLFAIYSIGTLFQYQSTKTTNPLKRLSIYLLIDSAVFTAYLSSCRDTIPSGPNCREMLVEGRYQEAIDCYTMKANEATDTETKAKYHLTVAKIYYGELKQYSKARSAAREALKHKPNWGDPYLLIGKLYASSGSLCGTGTGWNSQVVTWPAIDKWRKAKQVDSSVSKEANKLIGRYQQYMPSVEDIFQRGLKQGDAYKVPCWIQERTTIRAAK